MYKKGTLIGAAAFIIAFSAGWGFGTTEAAKDVNAGLATAIRSVGQNLLGPDIFGASIINPDITPTVQFDFGDTPDVPLVLNIFQPPDPIAPNPVCEAYAQIIVSSDGVEFLYDAQLLDPEAVETADDFVGQPPDPCRDLVALPG